MTSDEYYNAHVTQMLGDRKPDLQRTPEREALLLGMILRAGLINSAHGIIDDSVDGFPRDSHIGIAELCREIVTRAP
ncbi:hypothetical protein [Halocynthiibacter namhaensis]|uniref:hypothetical protein n=1 Tax=Halocynthiibacter namhaensis TaxID=1290553 RepID=UPI0012E038D7|nr:hypothetical protein [Halocynthiibacter namhaensis]